MDIEAKQIYGVPKNTVLQRYRAENYDRDMALYIQSLDPAFVSRMDFRVEKCIQTVLKEKGHCRILIPAIGSGRILSIIEPYFSKSVNVVAFDFNKGMMSAAETIADRKQLTGKCDFYECDILESNQTFEEDSFDLIVWEYSGCVVTDPVEAWKQLVSLCSKGGFLLYNDYIGAKDGNVAYNQNEIREAARTVGMRWFSASEQPHLMGTKDTETIITNGIISSLNVGAISHEHAIVWDPTYSFLDIYGSSWFSSTLQTVNLEVRIDDVMQSNVSSIFQKT